jgi:hypothetical protein
VLVVKERPDDLLLDHFWLLTSFSAAAVPAEDLLAHYRQRGTAEGHFGELMDVLAPALSSTPRTKSRYRDNPLPALPTGIDAAARNEAILLLHLLAYDLMHAGRRAMELSTHTGWSLVIAHAPRAGPALPGVGCARSSGKISVALWFGV